VLLLDEIGGGLTDAESAELVETVAGLRDRGIAVLWIEHIVHVLMQVVGRLVCMDAGRVIAEGTSDELKQRVGGDRIEVAVARDGDLGRAAEVARRQLSSDVSIDSHQRRLSGPSRDGTRQLASLVREFDAAGIEITDLQLHRPSLDDVFLTLTGRQAEEEKTSEPSRRWARRAS